MQNSCLYWFFSSKDFLCMWQVYFQFHCVKFVDKMLMSVFLDCIKSWWNVQYSTVFCHLHTLLSILLQALIARNTFTQIEVPLLLLLLKKANAAVLFGYKMLRFYLVSMNTVPSLVIWIKNLLSSWLKLLLWTCFCMYLRERVFNSSALELFYLDFWWPSG